MKRDIVEMWRLYKGTWRELPDALDTISFLIVAPFIMPIGLIYRAIKRGRK